MKTRLSIVLTLFMATTLSGCYSPNGAHPEPRLPAAERAFTQQEVDAAVNRDYVEISAPLNLNMPYACHSLRYNHFYPSQVEMAGDFNAADAVIMLMPGMQAGANVLNYLAEQVAFESQRQSKNIHVLTLERRNQCLIDDAGLAAAEAEQDIRLAKDYYYDRLPVDGKTFQGFYQDRDLPFLVEFGLKQVLEDMLTVAKHALPEQALRQEKLFIGGHSLGGNLTSAFMGWDFDGDESTVNDAGYNQAAGFLRFDIGITPKDASKDRFYVYGQNDTPLNPEDEANKTYRFQVHQMELGLMPRISRLPGATAETFMLLELVGMQAHWEPKAEATIIKEFQMGGAPEFLLRLIHSKDTLNFITNQPNILDFRFTNEALLGVILDDDYMPVGILQGSMGFLSDGPIKQKSFPGNDTIRNLAAGLDDFLGFLLSDTKQFIATDAGNDIDHLGSGPLYTWANYDEIGNELQPTYTDVSGEIEFTTYKEEMTDINTLARIIYQGKTGFTEWYMPQRLMMDIDQIRQPHLIEGLPFYHHKTARNQALLEVVATESFVDTRLEPVNRLVIAEGYNHMDVVTAANDTPSHRENVVVPAVLDFVFENIK